MTSATNNLIRNGTDSGGAGNTSATNSSTGAVAEQPISVVQGSTCSSVSHILAPGIMNIMYFPGQVISLATATVSQTSATLQWQTPGYDGGQGKLQTGTTYFIQVASYTSAPIFQPPYARIAFSTSNTSPGVLVSTPAYNLLANTTYWANLWTIDTAGNMSLVPQLSTFTTLTYAPASAVATFTAISSYTMTVSWSANGNPLNLTTYTVVLTSATSYPPGFPGDAILSSTCPFVAATSSPTATLGPPLSNALNPNTTYSLYVQSLNIGGFGSGYAPLGSTSTLTRLLTRWATDYVSVYFSSATLQWYPLSPGGASSATCEGYRLLASSTNFDALGLGGVVLSSQTYSAYVSTLAISTLDLNSTWYFQVGALNWNSVWNPVAISTQLNMQLSQYSNIFAMGIDPKIVSSTISVNNWPITNLGNLPVTLAVWGATATASGSPWSLGAAPGVETAYLQGVWDTVAPTAGNFGANDIISNSTATSQTNPGNYATANQSGKALPPGGQTNMWFQFWRPTATTVDSTKPQTIRVDVRPVYP